MVWSGPNTFKAVNSCEEWSIKPNEWFCEECNSIFPSVPLINQSGLSESSPSVSPGRREQSKGGPQHPPVQLQQLRTKSSAIMETGYKELILSATQRHSLRRLLISVQFASVLAFRNNLSEVWYILLFYVETLPGIQYISCPLFPSEVNKTEYCHVAFCVYSRGLTPIITNVPPA